jgi:hypothetical protein
MATPSQALQWIIDSATEIGINGRGVVAQTQTRSGIVRAVSRGGRIWRFTVSPSPGKTITEARPYLAALDYTDRIQTATIDLDHAGFEAFSRYQGTGSGTFSAVATGNNTITLTATSYTSGKIARAGDWIQLTDSSPPAGYLASSVYQVIEDPADGNGATVTLNRPIDQDAITSVAVGAAVSWTVICVDMPVWRLVPGGNNQLVEWSGDFVFHEYRVAE